MFGDFCREFHSVRVPAGVLAKCFTVVFIVVSVVQSVLGLLVDDDGVHYGQVVVDAVVGFIVMFSIVLLLDLLAMVTTLRSASIRPVILTVLWTMYFLLSIALTAWGGVVLPRGAGRTVLVIALVLKLIASTMLFIVLFSFNGSGDNYPMYAEVPTEVKLEPWKTERKDAAPPRTIFGK